MSEMSSHTLAVPRAIGALNAGSALVGVAVAAADANMAASLRRRTVALGGIAALGWSGAAANGRFLARIARERPRQFAAASLALSVLSQVGFGGWKSPMYLHGVVLAGTGATVTGPRRGEAFGALAAGGYLADIALSTSVLELQAEGDLMRIPVNAAAFVLAGSVGTLLAGSERRLRGLEHDVALGRDQARALRKGVERVAEADRELEGVIREVLATPQLSKNTQDRARAAAEFLLASVEGLVEADADGMSDPRRSLRRLVQWEQRLAGDRVALELTIDEAVPARAEARIVDAVATALLRALQNTRQHTKAATQVSIHVGGPDGTFELEVRDNGGGLGDHSPEEVLLGGGGLGDTRRELDNLGGRLELLSEPPHLTVRAILPLRVPPPRRLPASAGGDPVAALDADVRRALVTAAGFAAVDAISLSLGDPWLASSQRPRAVLICGAVVAGSGLVELASRSRRLRTLSRAVLAVAGIASTPAYRTPYGIWAGVIGVEVGWKLGWRTLAAYGAATAGSVAAAAIAAGHPPVSGSRFDVPVSLAAIPAVIGSAAALARRLRRATAERAQELGTLAERINTLWHAGEAYRTSHDFVQNLRPLLEEPLQGSLLTRARDTYDSRAETMRRLDEAIEAGYDLEREVRATVAARLSPIPVELEVDAAALADERSRRAVVLNLERRLRLQHLVGAAAEALLEAHPPGLFGRARIERVRVRVRTENGLARVDLTPIPPLRARRTPALERLGDAAAAVGSAVSRGPDEGRIYLEIDLGGAA